MVIYRHEASYFAYVTVFCFFFFFLLFTSGGKFVPLHFSSPSYATDPVSNLITDLSNSITELSNSMCTIRKRTNSIAELSNYTHIEIYLTYRDLFKLSNYTHIEIY